MVDVSNSRFKLNLYINILTFKFYFIVYSLRFRNNACLRIFFNVKN